jgi:hypothetical protein
VPELPNKHIERKLSHRSLSEPDRETFRRRQTDQCGHAAFRPAAKEAPRHDSCTVRRATLVKRLRTVSRASISQSITHLATRGSVGTPAETEGFLNS